MPELIDQMYCSQQIVIPPKFPYLLKKYCKAAIKTQPYDLLRWSYEYFNALAQHRPPPVKLRLEYPVFSTEGGLTRGCLKVLANQLAGMPSVPLVAVRQAWQGFCLDSHELNKILCLCEVIMRGDTVPFLHFIAVAGGLLTKTLTHTMILLCETLTHEPDGGSAAIPVQDFLVMYRFLAAMDASKDVKYLNGYREGTAPLPDSTTIEEEEHQISSTQTEEERMLLEMSGSTLTLENEKDKDTCPQPRDGMVEKVMEGVEIIVLDEDDNQIPYEIYGEPKELEDIKEIGQESIVSMSDESGVLRKIQTHESIKEYVNECYEDRLERIEDLELTFEKLANLVNRVEAASYDLGVVAGRQMSTSSGEFVVAHVQKEIMDSVNEQIDILPAIGFTKKKEKPEDVAMIKDLLNQFLDENLDAITPEIVEVEEEDQPPPEVITVHAVPGIGPVVDEDIVEELEQFLLESSKVQADLVMPRNLRHFMCPPVEKYEEHNYVNNLPKKEEVATGGVITD